MYCRNYAKTTSCVLCREVYYTVSLFGRVHYQRFHVTVYSTYICGVEIFIQYIRICIV